jgi:hypothetical protein
MADAPQDRETPEQGKSFAEEAQAEQGGFFKEFLSFLMHNKKWWLTPIIIVLLLVTLLIVLGGSAAAPFIYTLF